VAKYRLISRFTRNIFDVRVYGPQSGTVELGVVSAFQNIFDIAPVQLIVDETNRYTQQETKKKMLALSHFTLGL
jgi:hypothetical protein